MAKRKKTLDKTVIAKDGTEVGLSIKAHPIPQILVASLEIHFDMKSITTDAVIQAMKDLFKKKHGRGPDAEELRILVSAKKTSLLSPSSGNPPEK